MTWRRDAIRKTFLTVLVAAVSNMPASAQMLWDEIDTHEWIGEDWGSPITVSHVDFQGRRCLRATVTSATANWALIRTKRFLSEDWGTPLTSVRADVYVVNSGAASRLKLEVRAFTDFDTIVATLLSDTLTNDQWQTVTWTLPKAVGLDEVGHLSFVIDNIASLTPTVYIDELRLVTGADQEAIWDRMDTARQWSYAANWKDWSGIDPLIGFPSIEPVSSLDGSPVSPTASLYLEWDYNNGQDPGNDLAAVGTNGSGAGLDADFSTADRIRAWVRSSTNQVLFRTYFYDADADVGFFTPCAIVHVPNSWEELEWIIPWPPGFDRSDVDVFFLVVSGFAAEKIQSGWVRFDQVTLVSDQPPPGPEVVGRWLEPQPWPVVAIHAALLPTGKVLHYAYPGTGAGSRAYLWDPSTGAHEDVSMNTDIFCSGHSLLPDGKLYVTGGNDYECQFQGRVDTHTFDPFTKTWTKLEDMSVGRWYPTNITLGDGRVMILSGRGRDCVTTPVMEMYTPGSGLAVVPEGALELPLYPRMHLLTDGRVAYVGPSPDTYTFDPDTRVWEFVDFSSNGWRGNGTSVLIPGKDDQIMIIGGSNNGVATNSCEQIDFGVPSPQWEAAAPLSIARAHANVVILPSREVMVLGGGEVGLYCEPIDIPEMYDPDTGTWTSLPPQVFGRMYHSTAVLLPDGRILSAGQDSDQSGSWGEIYEPAYLFRGPRPTISSAPPQVAFGSSFTINTPDAASISAVAFIRLSVVTHSINIEQRYVGLQYSIAAPDQLIVTAPTEGNRAPPGYYMLFIVNGDDVPSVAHFVQLVDQAAIPAIGNVGLVILIATILAVGGWVLSRRTGFAQAA